MLLAASLVRGTSRPRNPRGGGEEGERILLVGRTNGGRVLTLVLERTLDPTSWLIVTGGVGSASRSYNQRLTAKNPWTDPDPQSGDFDAEVERARPDQIGIHKGDPDARLSIVVNVEGDDAKRLERIASERGQ